jgi:hypothetical protein
LASLRGIPGARAQAPSLPASEKPPVRVASLRPESGFHAAPRTACTEEASTCPATGRSAQKDSLRHSQQCFLQRHTEDTQLSATH